MAVGEWDQRQLCPDGGCIGVIGPDGTCRVCGHAAPNWGDERKRGLIETDDDQDDDDDDAEDDDREGRISASGSAASSRTEWSSRQLCPDGTCIGVIGPDGLCKVCRRSARGTVRENPGISPGEPIAAPAGAADEPNNDN